MRLKLQFYATVVCLVGILAGVVCKKCFPQYWYDLYVVVITTFWLLEMIMSFILERNEKNMGAAAIGGDRWMKVSMVCRFVKLVALVALIFIGLHVISDERIQIVHSACTIVFYLLNIAVESFVVRKK